LAAIGDAAEPLCQRALQSEDPITRQLALFAVGAMTTPTSLALAEQCVDDPNVLVVAAAAQAIVTRVTDPTQRVRVLVRLARAMERSVQEARDAFLPSMFLSARPFGSAGESAVPVLRNMLRRDEAPLGALWGLRWVNAKQAQVAWEEVLAALEHRSEAVRVAALEVLEELDLRTLDLARLQPPLEDRSERVRAAAWRVLHRAAILDPNGVEWLVRSRVPHVTEREAWDAAGALYGWLRSDERVIEWLLARLADAPVGERIGHARLLGCLRGDRARAALAQLASAGSPEERAVASEALKYWE
jgi:HEAT repeat protein